MILLKEEVLELLFLYSNACMARHSQDVYRYAFFTSFVHIPLGFDVSMWKIHSNLSGFLFKQDRANGLVALVQCK